MPTGSYIMRMNILLKLMRRTLMNIRTLNLRMPMPIGQIFIIGMNTTMGISFNNDT